MLCICQSLLLKHQNCKMLISQWLKNVMLMFWQQLILFIVTIYVSLWFYKSVIVSVFFLSFYYKGIRVGKLWYINVMYNSFDTPNNSISLLVLSFRLPPKQLTTKKQWPQTWYSWCQLHPLPLVIQTKREAVYSRSAACLGRDSALFLWGVGTSSIPWVKAIRSIRVRERERDRLSGGHCSVYVRFNTSPQHVHSHGVRLRRGLHV